MAQKQNKIKYQNKKPTSRWDITGDNRIMKLRVLFVFAILTCSVFGYSQYWIPNFVDESSYSNSGSSTDERIGNITADFGWQKNVRQLGYEDAVQFRFRSNGTVSRHYWSYDANLIKRNGTDKYDSGTYVITDSNSRRTNITITWANGRQQKCYIDYYSHTYAELHFDGKVYEELNQ